MSICATIGVPTIVDMDACIHDGFVLFQSLSQGVSRDYLYYYLLHASSEFASFGQPGTQKNINTSIVGNVCVRFPPLAEQQRIVESLDAWDRAIDHTERLLAAKRLRQRGLMRQLLTGAWRFSGYESDGWTTMPLQDIAIVRLSNVDKHLKSGEQSVLLCNYLDVYNHRYLTQDKILSAGTATSAEVERFRVCRGDVLMTKDSEVPNDIGVPAVIVDDLGNAICGYHLAMLRPRSCIEPVYLMHQLRSETTRRYFQRMANGVTRFALGYDAIRHTPIRMVSYAEQVRIAEALTAADREIALLMDRVAALREQKKGLMQQLLTGRKRLCVEGENNDE